jgi:hypothetical protein
MQVRLTFPGALCRLAMAVLIFAASLSVAAQTSPSASIDANTMLQLRRMPGTLLAQGSNLIPAGEVGLRSFILEELHLARAIRADINGQIVETTRAWRLTITGGPFPVRAMPAMVWLDDKLVGQGVESPDLSQLSVIFFNRTLLREGATISVSYGKNDPDRTALPEKLKLGSLK